MVADRQGQDDGREQHHDQRIAELRRHAYVQGNGTFGGHFVGTVPSQATRRLLMAEPGVTGARRRSGVRPGR